MLLKSDGRVAYVAYANQVQWRNHLGLPMPVWDDLPTYIQKAWHEAYCAVVNHHETTKGEDSHGS